MLRRDSEALASVILDNNFSGVMRNVGKGMRLRWSRGSGYTDGHRGNQIVDDFALALAARFPPGDFRAGETGTSSSGKSCQDETKDKRKTVRIKTSVSAAIENESGGPPFPSIVCRRSFTSPESEGMTVFSRVHLVRLPDAGTHLVSYIQ